MIPIGSDEDQTTPPTRGMGYRDEVAAIRRRIRSIELEAATFADLLALECLVELAADVREAIDTAGRAIRVGGASYGQLGDALGISRQAARKRFEP